MCIAQPAIPVEETWARVVYKVYIITVVSTSTTYLIGILSPEQLQHVSSSNRTSASCKVATYIHTCTSQLRPTASTSTPLHPYCTDMDGLNSTTQFTSGPVRGAPHSYLHVPPLKLKNNRPPRPHQASSVRPYTYRCTIIRHGA